MARKPYEDLEDWIYIVLRRGRTMWLDPDDAEDMAKDVTNFLVQNGLIKTDQIRPLPGPRVNTDV